MYLGKPSKLGHGKTWEKFPTGEVDQKNSQSFTWEYFFGIGGVKNFHKVTNFIKKGSKGFKNIN